MKHNAQTLIIDLDGTITLDENLPYIDKRPNLPLIKKLKHYKKRGFKIVIFTSRAMRTFKGDIEQIKANALPEILEWLEAHKVPYDEVVVGKIWCGESGFYVDDRAIRPSEFATLSFRQINKLLDKEKSANLKKGDKVANLATKSANPTAKSKKPTKSQRQKSPLDSALNPNLNKATKESK